MRLSKQIPWFTLTLTHISKLDSAILVNCAFLSASQQCLKITALKKRVIYTQITYFFIYSCWRQYHSLKREKLTVLLSEKVWWWSTFSNRIFIPLNSPQSFTHFHATCARKSKTRRGRRSSLVEVHCTVNKAVRKNAKKKQEQRRKKEAAVEATLQVVHVVAFLKSYGVTPSVVVVVVLVQVAFPASSLRSTTTVTVLVIVKVDAETSKKKHGRLLVTLLWREQRGLSMSSSY